MHHRPGRRGGLFLGQGAQGLDGFVVVVGDDGGAAGVMGSARGGGMTECGEVSALFEAVGIGTRQLSQGLVAKRGQRQQLHRAGELGRGHGVSGRRLLQHDRGVGAADAEGVHGGATGLAGRGLPVLGRLGVDEGQVCVDGGIELVEVQVRGDLAVV